MNSKTRLFAFVSSPRPRRVLAAGLVVAAAGLLTPVLPSGEAQAQSRELKELYTKLPRLYAQRDFEEAIKVAERALELAEDEFGDDHVATAALMNNLGVFNKEVGNLDRAEDLYEEALDIRRDRLGDNHLDVAQSLNNLGVLKQAKGELEEAEELFREALLIREDNLDPYHPDVAQTLNNLAVVYTGLEDFEEAEPLFEEALDLLSASASADTSVIEATLGNFADMYRRQGNAEAEADVRAELAELRGEKAETGVVLKKVDPESETAQAAQPQIAAASAPVPVPGQEIDLKAETNPSPASDAASDAETGQPGEGPPRDIFLPVDAPAAPDGVNVTRTAEAPSGAAREADGASPEAAAASSGMAASGTESSETTSSEMTAASGGGIAGGGIAGGAIASASDGAGPSSQESIFESSNDPLQDALRKVEQANASLEAMKRRQKGLPARNPPQKAEAEAEAKAEAEAQGSGSDVSGSSSDTPERQQVAAAGTAAVPRSARPYAIQVGVLKDSTRAAKLRQEVVSKGYPAMVFETKNKRGEAVYCVRFGSYSSLDAANLAARSYKTNTGKEGLIVRADPDSAK